MCNCKFDPYLGGDEEESWHYRRTCLFCGHQWYSLHCVHDGYQNPCPRCNRQSYEVLRMGSPHFVKGLIHAIGEILADVGDNPCRYVSVQRVGNDFYLEVVIKDVDFDNYTVNDLTQA